jgi:hypothetical protein
MVATVIVTTVIAPTIIATFTITIITETTVLLMTFKALKAIVLTSSHYDILNRL